MSLLKNKLYRNLLIIVGIFIIIFVILFAYQGCTGRNISYSKIEERMINGAKKYFERNELLPTEESGTTVVSSKTLIENKFLDSFNKMTNDSNCSGNVTVQKNGEFYNYMVYLKCDNYETKTLLNMIKEQIVADGDGLYNVGNEYIYKGEKVNNYVNFAEQTWRIVKITSDGYVKLVKEKKEEDQVVWDDRYNIVEGDSYGINDYEKSRLKEYIDSIYMRNDIIDHDSKKIITARDICVGERDESNVAFNTTQECNKKLPNQFISLLDVIDSAQGSIDKNCTNINSISCLNYNYFEDFFSTSWTTVPTKGSTSNAFRTSSTESYGIRASKLGKIFLVIYVNSNNIVISGKGSQEEPFVLF